MDKLGSEVACKFNSNVKCIDFGVGGCVRYYYSSIRFCPLLPVSERKRIKREWIERQRQLIIASGGFTDQDIKNGVLGYCPSDKELLCDCVSECKSGLHSDCPHKK